MGSKREEERNEKIIRGLMKLPPNRRCINCNSLGPQYACTNFRTFVCMPCSGIHREFTHRVKSVSMAKFTSEEVDALQKGGNQRARELYLNAWDPQKHRLPDNSNSDKVREFIKNVYVDKKYAVNNSSDRPPKDQQSIRSHEDEMRRASSYHSFSQSPPYDFQYEERRYGKPIASLARKPGSDHGLFEGKLSSFSSFSSPSRFSDHANDERFADEGSYPRVFDYSVSSGGDPFRSDVLSPNYQRETWSPFNEISSNLPSEIHGHHTVIHNSDANGGSNAGRFSGPQRTASSGSSGSFDSMSFKPVNSMGLHELEAEAKQSLEISHDKASSFPSPSSSSTSTIFNGLDLFNEPFAPQNFTSTPATVCSSRSPESFLAQSVDLFPQFPISSVPNIVEQQPAQTPQPLPQNGGWATFDASQNLSPVASQNSLPSTVPSSDGNSLEDFNLFSLDKIFSQNSTIYETSTPTHVLWDDCPKNVEPTNSTQLWSAFEDSPGKLPIENVLKDADQATALCTSNANSSLNIGVYEAPTNGGNISSIYENEIEPPSSLVSHSNMMMHDFAILPEMAGVHSVATAHKPTNPFDLCDADFESSDMSQFWDMSALQEALPDNQIQATYIGDTNESWFTQKSVLSYAPDGVTFDPPNEGSLGFVVARAPSAAISNVPAQGPVASIGGNPFA